MPEKENFEYDLTKENLGLQQEVQELDKKKQELMNRINKLQKDKSPIKSKERAGNQGLNHILTQKDQQIEDLQQKIDDLEGEIRKVNELPDYEFDLNKVRDEVRNSRVNSPEKGYRSRQKSALNKSNITNNSRYLPRSIERFDMQPKKTFLHNQDQSGTKFVNQLYNDIDRLLNKGQRTGYRNNYVY